jgi:hypothetical protein
MKKEWKHINLEFKNFSMRCATDGDTIRFRIMGMLPAEGNLAPLDELGEILKFEKDVVLNDPPEIEIKLPEKRTTALGMMLSRMFGGN